MAWVEAIRRFIQPGEKHYRIKIVRFPAFLSRAQTLAWWSQEDLCKSRTIRRTILWVKIKMYNASVVSSTIWLDSFSEVSSLTIWCKFG